jgi:hypothetical protein
MMKLDGMELDRDTHDFYLEEWFFVHGDILNTLKMSMKFDKDIIITNKFMHRKQILANGRNM